MKTEAYKTEVQRRLGEVLDKLGLECDYMVLDGVFIVKKQNIFIFEDKFPYRNIYNSAYQDKRMLQIHPDGKLTHVQSDDEVRIMYCRECREFFFIFKNLEMPTHVFCPKCGRDKIKLLSNNSRIPGWYGKDKVRLIDRKEAINHLDSCAGEEQDTIRELINRLSGEVDYIKATPELTEQVAALKGKYPNMEEVIDYLLQSFQTASMRENNDISFKPIVLVGSPGCGKTSFTTDLCRIIMGRKAIKVDLGNDVVNFTITANDPGFSKARHGMIVESLLSTDDRPSIKNPVIHFDELDKVHSDGRYSIETVFFAILEKNTARKFFDNYLGINVDASGINYIFTANSLEKIPAPILNRLRIFEIKNYTHEQLKEIVIDSFYEQWICNNKMEADFLPRVLSDYIKEMILNICHDDPRSIDDAISFVFNKTLKEDEKTHHKIALFSPEEVYEGWEKFRGAKAISKNPWELPIGFEKK